MTSPVVLTRAQVAVANDIYKSLAFQPSDPERDRTLGIVRGRDLVALGRLQVHAGGALEAGGFWVRDDYRGVGLARILVRAVLAEAPEDAEVWCTPFRHLTPFYRSFGMISADALGPLPDGIREKLRFCTAQTVEGTNPVTDLLVRPARRLRSREQSY